MLTCLRWSDNGVDMFAENVLQGLVVHLCLPMCLRVMHYHGDSALSWWCYVRRRLRKC